MPPATAATPIVPALAIRKRRRVQSGEATPGACPGVPRVEPDAASSVVAASARPDTETGAVGCGPSRLSRKRRVTSPAPIAMAALATAETGSTSGDRMAAPAATTPNTTKTAAPRVNRRAARMPAMAARAIATTITRTMSAALSFVPNSDTTTSFAPGGWRSIASAPTATMSDGAPNSPATSSEAAKAMAPAAAPAKAGAQRLDAARTLGVVMGSTLPAPCDEPMTLGSTGPRRSGSPGAPRRPGCQRRPKSGHGMAERVIELSRTSHQVITACCEPSAEATRHRPEQHGDLH